MSAELTRRDVDALVKVVNQRARLAAQRVDALKAQRVAEFEVDAIRQWDAQMLGIDQVVADINAQVDEVRKQMEQRLDELGVPKFARPRLAGAGVYAQESADRRVRGDLRKVITAEVDAAAKSAKVQIETEKLNVTEHLLVNALDSAEAKRLIEQLPTAEALLPALDATSLVQKAIERGAR